MTWKWFWHGLVCVALLWAMRTANELLGDDPIEAHLGAISVALAMILGFLLSREVPA